MYLSPIQSARAYDSANAPFTDMRADFTPPSGAANFLIKVETFWYRSGAPEGAAYNQVDHYRKLIPPGSPIPSTSCSLRYT